MFRKLAISGAALLVAGGCAFGADLPTRKGPPLAPVAAPYKWTGFYIGADVGGAWGSGKETFSNGAPTGDSDPSGVIGGGYVGYNQQFGQLVVGLEGDVTASDVKGSFVNLGGLTSVGGASFDWEEAIRARAGMAWDRALFYVAGGAAFADFTYKGGPAPGPACCGFSDSRTGYTVGAGVEYAVTDNLIARLEYRFNDFGAAQGGLSPTFPGVIVKVNNEYNEIRAGLEWKFGTARY
jgi:outer membrane immunogenic protein